MTQQRRKTRIRTPSSSHRPLLTCAMFNTQLLCWCIGGWCCCCCCCWLLPRRWGNQATAPAAAVAADAPVITPASGCRCITACRYHCCCRCCCLLPLPTASPSPSSEPQQASTPQLAGIEPATAPCVLHMRLQRFQSSRLSRSLTTQS